MEEGRECCDLLAVAEVAAEQVLWLADDSYIDDDAFVVVVVAVAVAAA